jgi:hypothetical protein
MKFFDRYLPYVAITVVAFLIGVLAGATPASAQNKVTEKLREKESRSFCNNNNWSDEGRVSISELRETTVAAGGTINVDGRQNGGISVKGEDRSDVLVRACIQAWSKSDEAAKGLASSVKISTSGTIHAEGPDEKGWSVSYELRVPRSSNINLTAHNGGISVTGVDGTAEFETQNGGVFLSDVAGNVKGRTTNGGVFVKLSGNSWKGTGLDVVTTNGGVNILMPDNYAAHVETGTVNGGFNSDIPALAITREDRNGDYDRRRATKISTDINGGGAPIRIITTNGGVRISTGVDRD